MAIEADTSPLWYIVHTYSGHEEKVKRNIQLRVETMEMGNKVFDVVVPIEKYEEIKSGKRVSAEKKIFPGYILVNMLLDDESWGVVRETPGVTGFVSTDDENETRSRPVSLEKDEVARILRHIASGPEQVDNRFEIGDKVRVTDGPFIEFMGTVDEVNNERSKLKVRVSFFGRGTPIELDFLQVEKD